MGRVLREMTELLPLQKAFNRWLRQVIKNPDLRNSSSQMLSSTELVISIVMLAARKDLYSNKTPKNFTYPTNLFKEMLKLDQKI